MDTLIRFARQLNLPGLMRAMGFGKLVGILNTWNLHRVRAAVAKPYLKGLGLEIGALHFPLRLPAGANAIYLDRASRDDNIRRYTDVKPDAIVKTDIIADGFHLQCIKPSSLNFLVANHVLEHTANVLAALRDWAALIGPSGYLFITVPIAEKCFDRGRPITTLDHFIEDLRLAKDGDAEQFAARTLAHYKDWVLISENNLGHAPLSDAQAQNRWKALADQKTEIHFHTFSSGSFWELMQYFCTTVDTDFRLVELRESGGEIIALLGRAPLKVDK